MKHIQIKQKITGIITGGLLLAMMAGIGGCTIDESINEDPNGISEAKLKSRDGVFGLLVGLQSITGDFYSGDRSRVNSIWTWQMCGSGLARPQPVAWNDYVQSEDGPSDDNWLNGYRAVRIANDILKYAPEVNLGSEGENQAALGIAKALKALVFGELAAMYGSIPIEINGLEPSPFVTQAAAYDKVQSLLSEALGHFAKAGGLAQDLNFGGDGAKWTAVCHSLKARYFLHVKKYAESLAEAKQGIAAADGNLFAIYTDNVGEYSPWGHWSLTEGIPGEQPIVVEKMLMNLLAADTNDTRRAEYFTPNADGNFVGLAAHGQSDATADEKENTKASSLRKYGQYADDFPMISFQENTLIVAECEARVGSVGTAVTELNKIRTAAGLADFSSSDATATIAEVLKQKYMQLFLEGQAYHDMRRTGTLPESRVPKRWIYPQSEKNANPNTPADADALVSTLVGP